MTLQLSALEFKFTLEVEYAPLRTIIRVVRLSRGEICVNGLETFFLSGREKQRRRQEQKKSSQEKHNAMFFFSVGSGIIKRNYLRMLRATIRWNFSHLSFNYSSVCVPERLVEIFPCSQVNNLGEIMIQGTLIWLFHLHRLACLPAEPWQEFHFSSLVFIFYYANCGFFICVLIVLV